MSAIAEAKGFGKAANELWELARKEKDPTKKAELERRAQSLAEDAEDSWRAAREEYAEYADEEESDG